MRAAAWRALVLPFVDEDEVIEAVYLELVRQYEENGRFYHNLHHIESVLKHIIPFLSVSSNLLALQLAAWFHDVVYDARRHDNETQSAVFARVSLTEMGLAEPDIYEVERLIMLTAGHETAVSDKDGHILLDADLAILAAKSEQYDAYAHAIRQEYAFVPDESYQEGRSNVLRKLAERPFLYYLPEHQNWEAKAKENMQRELNSLAR